MNIVIAGGGTAGHVNPAIALAETLTDSRVTFIGTAAGVESKLVPRSGFDLQLVEVAGFDRSRWWTLPGTGGRALVATKRSMTLLRSLRPDVVVGMGGYVSLPVGLAARWLRIPLVLHEQNIVLGLANRVLKRFAHSVGVSFEDTLREVGPRGHLVGNPVARRMVECDWAAVRSRALERFELDPARKTLLIFGGSLGARTINQAAAGLTAIWMGRKDRQVVHISGSMHQTEQPSQADLIFRSVDFVEKMEEAYAVADLALCRGGATTVAELSIAALASIVVPYPYHRDRQQERHARVLEEAGAAVLLPDASVTPEVVAETADRLLNDDEGLKEMSSAARRLARPEAARRLAALVIGASR